MTKNVIKVKDQKWNSETTFYATIQSKKPKTFASRKTRLGRTNLKKICLCLSLRNSEKLDTEIIETYQFIFIFNNPGCKPEK